MKNLNLRQDWHIIISQHDTEVQLEIYNALFAYNATGEFPNDLSDEAEEAIGVFIAPVFEQRRKAAEYRRRKKEALTLLADLINPITQADVTEEPACDIRALNRAARRKLERQQRKLARKTKRAPIGDS